MQNMNKGLLIVYNTCTIGWPSDAKSGFVAHRQLSSASDAIKQWMIDIKKIQSQDIENCKIVVTECRGPNPVQWDTTSEFSSWKDFLKKSNIDHIIVKEYLPFGQSVNHAVKTMIQSYGRYEYYMYWSSGFELTPAYDKEDNTILSKIYNCMQENKDICRANLFSSNDNYPPVGYDHNINTELYTITPGHKIHDHCSIYSDDWVLSFNDCIRPDIYKGNGSEPLFPYMAASIGKRCIILPKQICPALTHHKRNDGEGNPGIGNRMDTWYIKNYTNNEFTYLNKNELIEKRDKCRNAGMIMTDSGQIASGVNEPKLSNDQRNNLYQFILNEFFVTDFDYININGEIQ